MLITGASKGLGKELARYFWERGFNLILVSRDRNALQRCLLGLKIRETQTSICIPTDLSDENSVNDLIRRIGNETPSVDYLINNAAMQGPIGPAIDNDWTEWKQTLQVNLLAPVALCRAIAASMIKQNYGSIISLSGGGATSPRSNFSAYAVAKTGLVRFSETLAEELLPYGIRVNCIAPGVMKTDLLSRILSSGKEAAGEKEFERATKVLTEGGVPLMSVVKLCEFLISDESQEITGKLISAVWDHWSSFPVHIKDLKGTDIYTLRRIVPTDRGKIWER